VRVLDRLRMTFRWKADDLDAAGLGTRIGASALTLGGLLKHMAINEDFVFTRKLTGEPVGEPWESLWDGTDDWEFTSAAEDTPGQLYGFWEAAVERSRARLDAALQQGGLDQLVHISSTEGEPAPTAVRSDRGVRPPHRTCRPASRSRRRTRGRGSAAGMAAAVKLRPMACRQRR
jgi:Protein of unknown function (DUF664)